MSYIASGYTMGIMDTIWPIAFVLIVSLLFYFFREDIRNNSTLRKSIPYLLLGLIIVFEIGMYWNLVQGLWRPFETTVKGLPLHLCSTSAVLVMLYLIFKKEILLQMLIIQGMVGALVTFIFPSSASYPFSYDYIRFFLSHAILFITPMFFIIIEGARVDKKTLKIAFIFVHLLAIVAVITNLTFGTHYMYILPDNSENLFHFLPLLGPLPFLGNWPWVIVVGELLVFPVYFLFYFGLRKFQTILD